MHKRISLAATLRRLVRIQDQNMDRRLRVQAKGMVLLLAMCSLGITISTSRAADENGVVPDSRLIELQESAIKIRLIGSSSYQVTLDGRRFSRELPQRRNIRLRGRSFDPMADAAEVAPRDPGDRPRRRGRPLYRAVCHPGVGALPATDP